MATKRIPSPKGWIGVDFDGTLAHYEKWQGHDHAGPPVPAMVERIRQWLMQGYDVKVFTARIWPLNQCIDPEDERALHATFVENQREDDCWVSIETIRKFCREHIGVTLPITNVKDFQMRQLWDDHCVTVGINSGKVTFEDVEILK